MIKVKITLLDGITREYETFGEYCNETDSLILHSHDDKPAYVEYYNDGSISCKIWYKKGKRHREGDKPAYMNHDREGNILNKGWYKEGKKITEEEAKAYNLCKDGHDYVEAACGDYKANVCRRCLAREGGLI